jgi:hypothetical protein
LHRTVSYEKTHEWLERIEPILGNTFWSFEYQKAILIGTARTYMSHLMIEKYFVNDLFKFKDNLYEIKREEEAEMYYQDKKRRQFKKNNNEDKEIKENNKNKETKENNNEDKEIKENNKNKETKEIKETRMKVKEKIMETQKQVKNKMS